MRRNTYHFRYVYARIASLKAMAEQVVTKFQENIKHLDMFLNREKVPIPMKKTMMDYWKYQWKRTGGWSVSWQIIIEPMNQSLTIVTRALTC